MCLCKVRITQADFNHLCGVEIFYAESVKKYWNYSHKFISTFM
jgi:hypothetical protein